MRLAGLLVGFALLGIGIVVAGVPRVSSPAVAAPGARDGMSLVTLARAPAAAEGNAAPAPAAEAAPVARPLDGVASAAPAAPAVEAEPAPAPVPLVEPGSDVTFDEFVVHLPPTLEGRRRVLVVVHGMEGSGPRFLAPLRARADAEGWVVVAPTFGYGDWQDPAQVAREGSRFIPRLSAFLAELPARTGLDLDPRVAIYGASRGGQLAHRFALVYPTQTRVVAALAPGTYTLPQDAAAVEGRNVRLPYPFGVADLPERFGRDLDLTALQRVQFWVGVGGADNDPADVPRQWDPFLGDNRVMRAQTFARRLTQLGATVELTLFPGLGHVITDEMQARALDFVASRP